MRRSTDGAATIRDWLGINGEWPGPDGDGTIEDYLLSHTRLIPRDIISLGNELSEAVLRQKQAGRDGVPTAALDEVLGLRAQPRRHSQRAPWAKPIPAHPLPQKATL